jgi:hypothetical protein
MIGPNRLSYAPDEKCEAGEPPEGSSKGSAAETGLKAG